MVSTPFLVHILLFFYSSCYKHWEWPMWIVLEIVSQAWYKYPRTGQFKQLIFLQFKIVIHCSSTLGSGITGKKNYEIQSFSTGLNLLSASKRHNSCLNHGQYLLNAGTIWACHTRAALVGSLQIRVWLQRSYQTYSGFIRKHHIIPKSLRFVRSVNSVLILYRRNSYGSPRSPTELQQSSS